MLSPAKQTRGTDEPSASSTDRGDARTCTSSKHAPAATYEYEPFASGSAPHLDLSTRTCSGSRCSAGKARTACPPAPTIVIKVWQGFWKCAVLMLWESDEMQGAYRHLAGRGAKLSPPGGSEGAVEP